MNKNWIIPLVVALGLGFGASGFAGELVSGTVVKLEKEFVTVEDFEIGDMIRVHYDNQTKVNGKLKEGASVDMEVEGEHAVSIDVISPDEEELEETDEDM
ncbi:MAG TPA: hypothetical protein VGB26_07165 [Nitrospiria bacterium]|jgi:hypothetical protein